MKQENFIENDTKVLDFMAMTETGDPEVAKKYLEAAKWDVTAAVNTFFSQINVNNNIPRNEINTNNNILNTNLNNNNQININEQENESFLSRYIISPISGIFNALIGACKERREIDLDEEERIFHFLKFSIFCPIKFMILINFVNLLLVKLV